VDRRPPCSGRKNSRHSTLLPLAALVVAAFSVQFGATYAEGLFGVVGAQGATALRLALSALMLAVAFRPWRGPIPQSARPTLLAYGAALGCMNMLFYLALRSVPLGVAVALEFLGPLAVTLRHLRRPVDALWVALAVGGLYVLLPIGPGLHGVDPLGAVCALGAGVCWAIYMIVGRRVGVALGTRAVALGTMVAALLAVPFGLAHAGAALFTPSVLLRGLVVAVFSSALPYTLEMVALTRLPTRLFGTLTALEPAVAALMGLLLLHQALPAPQWVAIGAIMLAAAGAVWAG
jgi:inner membrane transporter RhtA